jgi:hypothetical protein
MSRSSPRRHPPLRRPDMSSTDTIPTISVLEDQVRQCRAALLVIPPDRYVHRYVLNT